MSSFGDFSSGLLHSADVLAFNWSQLTSAATFAVAQESKSLMTLVEESKDLKAEALSDTFQYESFHVKDITSLYSNTPYISPL